MIGIRGGVRVGIMGGSRNGSGVDQIAPQGPSVPSITADAISGKLIPQSSTEWSALLSSAGISTGIPTSLWKCQEASGSLADSIGSNALASSGTPGYATSIPGWASEAVTFSDGSSDQFNNSLSVPDPATNSLLLLAYAYVINNLNGDRLLIVMGGSTFIWAYTLEAGHYELYDNGVTAIGSASPFDGTVHPVLLKYDITNLVCTLYTDSDKMTAAIFTPFIGKGVYLGSNATPPAGILYASLFSGSAAELSDAQVRSLLQAMGWAVSW